MKYCLRFTILYLFFCVFLIGARSYGQQVNSRVQNGMTAGARNYTSFTPPYKDNNPEIILANKDYEQHPELGMLFAEAPCDHCYELIGDRTEISKTYIKEGTGGRDIMQQTSSAPMHYKDAAGNWRTIISRLGPGSVKGVYAATAQPQPVTINAIQKFVALGKADAQFQFNNDLELVYVPAGGSEIPLGKADWSHHTAGDDGVYVTSAWPGIDIEIYTIRGAVKTNFIISHALPSYAGGKLLVRDHFHMGAGLKLSGYDQPAYTGNLAIINGSGEHVFDISAATAFEKFNARGTMQMLEYHISDNTVDIVLPGNFLNRAASSYPVIIDPLVSASTNSTVTGSTYSAGWTTGCVYTNPATVPAKVTVTDVQFSFQYVTSGGALLNNGAFDFYLGTCRSPGPPTIWWNCNSTLTGTCTGTNASIIPSLTTCLPAPQCSSYNLNMTMDFYQNYASTAPCNTAYISAGSPLNITVFGHTIESAAATASPSLICQGLSSSVSASANYGVTPYTYTWYPGGVTGSPATVSPAATTLYTVVVADACGDTSMATTLISVNPLSPINGNTQVCAGSTTALSNTSGSGTWSSSNTSVATITNSGIVSGITAGTSVISYATPSGCSTSTTVTVNALPASITGNTTVCAGSTTTLSDATTGGTWSSGSLSVATVGPASGIVSGLSGGNALITYTTAAGCTKTTTVVVNPLLPITGSTNVCQGGTLSLADATPGGGAWSSSSTSVATVSGAGTVYGITTGTSVITFTTTAGCFTTTTVTVLPQPPGITGNLTVCQGSATQLSDATAGGTWSSGNTTIATVNAGGSVTGALGGVVNITYTATNGCTTSTVVAVHSLGPITGNTTVCQGGTTILSDLAGPGTWTSSNTSVATISYNTGVVSGITTGTTTVSYTSLGACVATAVVTVNLASPITGPTTVCQGGSTTLSDATGGGTWTSSNTSVATITITTGIVNGITGGSSTVTYTSAGGCYVTASVTVNAVTPILGPSTICQGTSTTLSDATTGGTWSCTNTAIATIGLTTGIISGAAGGTTSAVYTTLTGCTASIPITVVSLPAPITGNTNICNSAILSDATPGGTWSSATTSVATVTPSGGTVTGVSNGATLITYNITGGCFVTTTVTVNVVLPITGNTMVCAGSSTALSDATTGGAWSSSNTGIATISTAGGPVSGVTAGVCTITYGVPSGCYVTASFTVNAIAPVTGNTTICQGSTSVLSDAAAGGTWSSGNTSVATIGLTSGIAGGVSAGTTTVTYIMPTGCSASASVTVNPVAPVTGNNALCSGYTMYLSDAVAGGTWSSNSTAVATIDLTSGLLYGVAAGTATIGYFTPAGCVSTYFITVNKTPLTITGNTIVCQGSTSVLSDSPGGGAWSSGNTSIATIGTSSGVLSGVAAGTTTVVYSTPAGCSATTTVTVNPTAPITGNTVICQGATSALSNSVTGGTWSSGNTSVATTDVINGIVYGVAGGTAGISYTTAAGCVISVPFTVNTTPAPIAGNTIICQGNTSTLSNSVAGGTWSSATTSVATIGVSNGITTAVSPGTSVITYSTSAGCTITTTVTINPLSPITGSNAVCQGSSITLSDAVTGGTWSSGNTAIATVDAATGDVNGVSAGIVNISYTTSLGCVTAANITVNRLPSAIAGIKTVCAGSTVTLSNSVTGGTWSSANTGVATIGLTSGIVTGAVAGTSLITYTSAAGCIGITTITVNPLPDNITGNTSVCQNNTTTLSDATAGGTWSSSNVSVATIGGTTGILTGVSAGTAIATYTSALGCYTTNSVTVYPLPSAITGIPVVCTTSFTTLSDALPGGTWSSSNSGVAAIGMTTGIVSGFSAGTAVITYITPAGCFTTTTVTVNQTPKINSIISTDPTNCLISDGTIILGGLMPGIPYTVNYLFGSTPVTITLTANIAGNIVITGLAAGSYSNFTVTTAAGCTSLVTPGPIILSLPPTPATPVAGSNSPLCDGDGLHLTASDATTGVTYSWSGPGGFTSATQNPVISPAHVNQSGIYTVTVTKVGCISAPDTITVVINPIPVITGLSSTDPTTCMGADGTITLSGLTPGLSYFITYLYNSDPASVTIIANGSGKVVITGLSAGLYSDFSASSFTCVSATVGPVTLNDPPPPPPPHLTANTPVCAGAVLYLHGTDAVPDVTYSWVGPNGFTSGDQDPVFANIQMTDSGYYVLTVSRLNCNTSDSIFVGVYPPVVLTDVTQSQEMPYGGYVQLYAQGALYYLWTPDNGTISDPTIYNPTAAPKDSTTYTVIGMNQWGCRDSANVTITIDYGVYDAVPNSFTPNGDGKNDVFRIVNQQFVKLVDFSVYDRWGNLVYHNTYDAKQGWDGNYNGKPQDMGVYFYSITIETPDGKTKYFKGDVTLIR